MPELDATGKMRIYGAMYRMSRSFANIVAQCHELQESGILSPRFTRLYQSYAQELQAEINEDVVSVMDDVELRDMHRFGKARVAREKELRDPNDVFIHAEERRKELAKQGKTPRVLKSARKRTPERRNPSRPRRKKPISLGG